MEPAAFARPAAGWTGPTEPRPLLALGAGLRVLAPLLGLLALLGPAPLWTLAALACLNGLLSTLAYATGSTLLPRLVGPEHLTRANSLSSGALMGAPLVGYGVGGGLVHALGAGGTLLASAPFILGLTVAALLLPPLSGATGTGGCARWPTCGKGWGAFAVRCWVCWA